MKWVLEQLYDTHIKYYYYSEEYNEWWGYHMLCIANPHWDCGGSCILDRGLQHYLDALTTNPMPLGEDYDRL